MSSKTANFLIVGAVVLSVVATLWVVKIREDKKQLATAPGATALDKV